MKRNPLCSICAERPRVGHLFCQRCARGYDASLRRDESIAALVLWAAKRTRHFALKGHKSHFERGAVAAADLADNYNGVTQHEYRLGDCILGKLNIRKGRPRKNTRMPKWRRTR